MDEQKIKQTLKCYAESKMVNKPYRAWRTDTVGDAVYFETDTLAEAKLVVDAWLALDHDLENYFNCHAYYGIHYWSGRGYEEWHDAGLEQEDFTYEELKKLEVTPELLAAKLFITKYLVSAIHNIKKMDWAVTDHVCEIIRICLESLEDAPELQKVFVDRFEYAANLCEFKLNKKVQLALRSIQ
jgi:hypothetical protein